MLPAQVQKVTLVGRQRARDSLTSRLRADLSTCCEITITLLSAGAIVLLIILSGLQINPDEYLRITRIDYNTNNN
jgi:hypothetical protein